MPAKATPEDVTYHADLLQDGMSRLSQLQELTFEKCRFLDDTLIAKLPHDLRRLSISNCGSFTSKGLQCFLQICGQTLLNLSLVSNQAMQVPPRLRD